MQHSKLIKILFVLAAFLIAIALAVSYRQIPHGQEPFAKTTDKADAIQIQQGSSKLELVRKGNDWKVATPQGEFLEPEPGKVKTLLSGLHDLQVEDEISSRAERAGDFETTPTSGTAITLKAKGSTLAQGLFGKQSADFAHIYFRFPDKPSVYLARGIIRGELGGATVNDWRSHELINVSEAQIQSITITAKGVETHLGRSSDTWTLDGEKIEPGPVYSLVGALSHLRVADFVDPAAQPPITFESLNGAKIEIKTGSGIINLRIGASDPATHRYPASISKESGIGWISEAQVKTLLRKPSDFRPVASKPAP